MFRWIKPDPDGTDKKPKPTSTSTSTSTSSYTTTRTSDYVRTTPTPSGIPKVEEPGDDMYVKRLLGESSTRKKDNQVVLRTDEAGVVDQDLIKIRNTFSRKDLPAAWDVPLDWKARSTGPMHVKIKKEEEPYDYVRTKDDDDAWDRLLNGEQGNSRNNRKKKEGENHDPVIEFRSNDVNREGTIETYEVGGCTKKFIPSLPPPKEDAPYIEVPGIEGTCITEDPNDIPECKVWRELTTTKGTYVAIKVFDMSLIRPDFTISIYGKRRSGKTQFTRHFLKAMRPYFPEVYVFTLTKVDNEYTRFVPDKYIFEGYQDAVVDAILRRQEARQRDMRKRGVNDININVLLILDDCITNDVLKYSETMKTIFYNGRHLYMSIVVNSQDHKAITPGLRTNTDMVACFPVRSQRDKEAVRENYADFVKNDADFEEVADVVRETPYTILFIDQSRPYMLPEECVYAGIAATDQQLGGFFMGTRDFWRGSELQAMVYEGAENWLALEDWGITKDTYHFTLNQLPEGVTMALPQGFALGDSTDYSSDQSTDSDD